MGHIKKYCNKEIDILTCLFFENVTLDLFFIFLLSCFVGDLVLVASSGAILIFKMCQPQAAHDLERRSNPHTTPHSGYSFQKSSQYKIQFLTSIGATWILRHIFFQARWKMLSTAHKFGILYNLSLNIEVVLKWTFTNSSLMKTSHM